LSSRQNTISKCDGRSFSSPQKIADVVFKLSEDYSEDDFIVKFQEIYPEGWEKIEKRYRKHLRDGKPGKAIPMPEPRKYLLNALKVWKKKQENVL